MERGENGADRADPAEEVRVILAPNPSPMTYQGTNTYILGHGEVAVVDPGPAIAAHLDAIRSALAPGERVGAILVTHSHLDHSPLAGPLAEATGAPVLAAGPSDWGRSPVMQALAETGDLGGGEGVDPGFAPDRRIAEGDAVEGAWGRIDVLSTPGHMANHLSFAWRGALFPGDTVMGWASSLVSPPDGDMTAFMATLERLSSRRDRRYYPGHGPPVEDPAARLKELIAHRRGREAAILRMLKARSGATAAELASAIYDDLDPPLLPAAARNVLAHLIDLHQRNLAATEGPISAGSRFLAS